MAEVVERVANLEGRFDAQAGELVRVRDTVVALDEKVERRFEAVDRRFDALDQKIDARFLAVDQRLLRIDERIDALDRKFDRKLDVGFSELRAELRSHFRWIMGGIGGAVVTVIMSLFAKDWWW